MSWWIWSQDQKTGKRYVWSIGGDLLIMAILALLVALVAPWLITLIDRR